MSALVPNHLPSLDANDVLGSSSGGESSLFCTTPRSALIDRVLGTEVGKERYRDVLAEALALLLEAKPTDPLEFLIAELTFPFSQPTTHRDKPRRRADVDGTTTPPSFAEPPSAAADVSHVSLVEQCSYCARVAGMGAFRLPNLAAFSRPDCCTYDVRMPFAKGGDATISTLARFLSSNETVAVMVGDDDLSACHASSLHGTSRLSMESSGTQGTQRRSTSSSSFATSASMLSTCSARCQCVGAGKSKLCRWLQFPGRFVHGRKVITVNSSNTDSFLRILEESEGMTTGASDSGTESASPGASGRSGSLRRRAQSDAPQHRLLSSLSSYSRRSTTTTPPRAVPLASTVSAQVLPPATAVESGKGDSLCSSEPTLTLIDSIEPPHFIMHALYQHGYFRAEKSVRCPFCRSVSRNVAIHKTIVFTRRDVFFKFPLPCPIYVMARVPQGSSQPQLLESFLDESLRRMDVFDVGDNGEAFANTARGQTRLPRRSKGSLGEATESSLGSSQVVRRRFLPSTSLFFSCNDDWCRRVILELQDQFRLMRARPMRARSPITVANSATFRASCLSRTRCERALAQYLVAQCALPELDLSEFPLLLTYIVTVPRSDVYVLRNLVHIRRQARYGSPDRLAIGNLLCLVIRSQQCLSAHHAAMTAHDVLQLYLGSFAPFEASPCVSFKPARMASPSPLRPLDVGGLQLESAEFSHLIKVLDTPMGEGSCGIVEASYSPMSPGLGSGFKDTLSYLDLQDIIIEHVQVPSPRHQQLAPLVAHTLLDVRGSDMEPALQQLLVQGTTLSHYNHMSLGESFESVAETIRGAASRYGHPVLLTSDATTVGDRAYVGKAETASRRPLGLHSVLHCFLVRLVAEGCSAVIVVEKNRLYAQSAFSEADTFLDSIGDTRSTSLFWTIQIAPDRCVVHVSLLSQNALTHERSLFDGCASEDDIIVLLLSDGTTLLVSVSRVPRGAIVRIDRAPITPSVSTDGGGSSSMHPSEGTTPCSPSAASMFGSSRVTLDLSPLAPPETQRQRPERFMMAIAATRMNTDREPLLCAMSASFLVGASSSQDTLDILTVIRPEMEDFLGDRRNSFLLATSTHSTPGDGDIVIQTDDAVTAVAILRDRFLLAGLKSGNIQVFDLLAECPGSCLHTFQFHEQEVTVIRPLSRSGNFLPPSDSLAVGRGGRNTERFLCFVSGSEDNTMAFFSVDDLSQLKSSRCHFAPIVDICATHFVSNRVIVSCDTSGVVIVSAIVPDDLQAAMTTVWRSSFPNIRSLHMTMDGSWLVVSRQSQQPQAIPVAEWTRHGVGQFHHKAVTVLHLTRCERFLLTGGGDGTIFVWDLTLQARHALSFRKHTPSAAIVSISTSADSAKVISSDSFRFVQLWNRANGSVIRTINREEGASFCRFLPFDFVVVRTRTDFKIFNEKSELVLNSRGLAGGTSDCREGAIDFYFATEADMECFQSDIIALKGRRHTQQPLAAPSSDTDDDDGRPDPFERYAARDGPVVCDDLLARLFIAVTSNVGMTNEVHIYHLSHLERPLYVLRNGEVDDDFSDEEMVGHDDTVTLVSFLPPRPVQDTKGESESDDDHTRAGADVDPAATDTTAALERTGNAEMFQLDATVTSHAEGIGSPLVTNTIKRKSFQHSRQQPQTPNLFLAATCADDLTTIVWNWWKQQPLIVLPHTNFLNSVAFVYPTASAASFDDASVYTPEDVAFLRQHDPAYLYCHDGGPLCLLLTAQDAPQSGEDITMRIHTINEKPDHYQRRCLLAHTGGQTTVRAFNTIPLNISEVGKTGHLRHSVRALALRRSDALICAAVTGPSDFQIVFFRWMTDDAMAFDPTAGTPSLGPDVGPFSSSSFMLDNRPGLMNPGFSSRSNDTDSDSDATPRPAVAPAVVRPAMKLRPLRRIAPRM